MPDARTDATEIGTALGMLGYQSFTEAINRQPIELVNVSPECFDRLRQIGPSSPHYQIANAAFGNGAAFLNSSEGLRGRIPIRIEWKGPDRPPGYDMLPADLRIDHVYLVSCKYQSKILMNSSPANLFDNLLSSRMGSTNEDWYALTAKDEYDRLYRHLRSYLGNRLPASISLLSQADKNVIKNELPRKWPVELQTTYDAFSAAVSNATALRWSTSLKSKRIQETLLWRMLRLSESPYFILGTDAKRSLRLRIATPWDWRQQYRMVNFEIWWQPSKQPRVEWEAVITHLQSGDSTKVRGHVEIRWSHGRFCGRPEAKIYLDTPHDQVPGYFTLPGNYGSLLI